MAKRSSSLASLTTADLQREIRNRQRRLPALLKRRAKVVAKLTAIEAEIEGLGASTGGSARGGARVRVKNEMNLTDALLKVLKGQTLGVTEVAAAVQAAGYSSSSANFRVIVNQNLIKNRKLFKKVSRGRYTAT
jgi:hypothetical protein